MNNTTKHLAYALATSWTNGTTEVRWGVGFGDPSDDAFEQTASGVEILNHADSDEIRTQLLEACVTRLESRYDAKYIPLIARELPEVSE